jgi:hypothetical protein
LAGKEVQAVMELIIESCIILIKYWLNRSLSPPMISLRRVNLFEDPARVKAA